MIINQANLKGIYNSFSTIFNKALATANPMWQQIAMVAPSAGRAVDYKWLGDFPQMREWLGDRVVKDLSAFKYEIVNKDFEATVGVDKNDIEDDLIGIYGPMIEALGQAAAEHSDILVWALLKAGFETPCYDGQYFFDSDHDVAGASVSNTGGGAGTPWYLADMRRPMKPIILQMRQKPQFASLDRPEDENVFMRKQYLYGVDDRKNVGYGLWQLAYGSKQTLDATNYSAGRAAMMAFKNERGTPLGIMPTHCFVPPSLESAGRPLLEGATLANGASNPWFNTCKLVVVPWLA